MDSTLHSSAVNTCRYGKATDEIKFPLPIIIRLIVIRKCTEIRLDRLGWYDPSTEKDREFSHGTLITLFLSIST